MRISDWSSDVCSSDLSGKRCPRSRFVERRMVNKTRVRSRESTVTGFCPQLRGIVPPIGGHAALGGGAPCPSGRGKAPRNPPLGKEHSSPGLPNRVAGPGAACSSEKPRVGKGGG